jgi:hypothetical protein
MQRAPPPTGRPLASYLQGSFAGLKLLFAGLNAQTAKKKTTNLQKKTTNLLDKWTVNLVNVLNAPGTSAYDPVGQLTQ